MSHIAVFEGGPLHGQRCTLLGPYAEFVVVLAPSCARFLGECLRYGLVTTPPGPCGPRLLTYRFGRAGDS